MRKLKLLRHPDTSQSCIEMYMYMIAPLSGEPLVAGLLRLCESVLPSISPDPARLRFIRAPATEATDKSRPSHNDRPSLS